MRTCADLLEKKVDAVAGLESKCMGCPILLAKRVAQQLPIRFRFYAGLIDKIQGQTYPEDGDGVFKMVQYDRCLRWNSRLECYSCLRGQ